MDEIKTPEEAPGSGRLTALRVPMNMSHWQYLYSDVQLADEEFRRLARQSESSLDALEEFFPAWDCADLRARLEAREGRRRRA
ncbi:hypothetical protein [Streptomyces sp. HD]|uniref:hypothetical protein n=1 Tax=Streptomyces sp. HD TaxID=3020892 RepID=UPI00232E5948|nr:hypothetical protein [Streptomyces sp. HD]MDC0766614.1 hypothetical protein [Streptomyces sp. HD]